MTVEIEVGATRHRVELNRGAQGWQAIIDGRSIELDAVRVASGWSVLLGAGERMDQRAGAPPDRPRTSYEVAIDQRGDGVFVVHVEGQALSARIIDPRAYVRRRHGRATGSEGNRHVTSAMPGRVVKLLVKAGERVSARQGLVVVEAMKMENELRSPADAVVREVRTSEGASVEAGAILIVLE